MQSIAAKLKGNVHPDVINVLQAQQVEIAELKHHIRDAFRTNLEVMNLLREVLGAVQHATGTSQKEPDFSHLALTLKKQSNELVKSETVDPDEALKDVTYGQEHS